MYQRNLHAYSHFVLPIRISVPITCVVSKSATNQASSPKIPSWVWCNMNPPGALPPNPLGWILWLTELAAELYSIKNEFIRFEKSTWREFKSQRLIEKQPCKLVLITDIRGVTVIYYEYLTNWTFDQCVPILRIKPGTGNWWQKGTNINYLINSRINNWCQKKGINEKIRRKWSHLKKTFWL